MALLSQGAIECDRDHVGAPAGSPGGFAGRSLCGRWVLLYPSYIFDFRFEDKAVNKK